MWDVYHLFLQRSAVSRVSSHTILADQGQTKRSNFYWKWIMIVVPGLGVTDHIFFGDGRMWKKDIAGMRTSFLPLSLREVGC